jgi:hypothetical protein
MCRESVSIVRFASVQQCDRCGCVSVTHADMCASGSSDISSTDRSLLLCDNTIIYLCSVNDSVHYYCNSKQTRDCTVSMLDVPLQRSK